MVRNNTKKKISLTAIFAVALFFCPVCIFAQGTGFQGSSYVGAIESIIGPLFPPNGIAGTFRSEVGTGISAIKLAAIKVTGSVSGEFDLKQSAYLETTTIGYQTYACLRLWRFGARATYTLFDARSEQKDFAKFEFTGLKLGGDFDLVQFNWLAVGVSTDFYFMNPQFNGELWSRRTEFFTMGVQGDRPILVGSYLRYIPPEILGFPLHLEAFAKLPVSGTKLTTLGVDLVFRPQIYRFDVAAKLGFQRENLQFRTDPKYQVGGAPLVPIQEWKFNGAFNHFKLEVAVYF